MVIAVATTVASAPAHVLVRPSDSVLISARLTGVRAQQVTGILAPQQRTLPSYQEDLSIPSELTAFHAAEARLDLYDQQPLRPFVPVAMFAVLVVVGAAAMMPLQSLDAEFRWSNYEAGVIVSIASVLVFFVVPLWGVHAVLKAQKLARSEELQVSINVCDRRDIVRLAHRQPQLRSYDGSVSSYRVGAKFASLYPPGPSGDSSISSDTHSIATLRLVMRHSPSRRS